ncbi:hypothetical protein Zmor_008167 [Zophobas morio]|uniref:Uncharacterized protein n=1 Tax=Zophobas morio TaxID=2755281 RepID=A0AA38MQJ3_9CUCU|nr:hypothetical protein Zmor_008167 [Zophobas morio]
MPPGVAPSVRSGGRSGASRELARDSRGGSARVALKPETLISGGEGPRKQDNKIKRQGIFYTINRGQGRYGDPGGERGGGTRRMHDGFDL